MYNSVCFWDCMITFLTFKRNKESLLFWYDYSGCIKLTSKFILKLFLILLLKSKQSNNSNMNTLCTSTMDVSKNESVKLCGSFGINEYSFSLH